MIEKAVSGFFLLFSIAYLYFAKDLAFGSLDSPKAGFLPYIAGTVGVILAAVNFFGVIRKKTENNSAITNSKRVILFALGLIVYLILLKFIGYAISTFLITIFLIKITDTKGWVVPLVVSAGTAAGFYFVFVNMLGVAFP